MASFRIECVVRDSNLKRITHVGIAGIENRIFPISQIIHWINREIHTFYTLEEGHMARVFVRHTWWGSFLATSPDAILEDNLGYLPECDCSPSV
ncbi:MAG: DUF3892 domain-containing protein [Thaumarchaeota archaeon]|nr:DUF3892 domain-containing protein [Nitrososphaerota archaeon]